MKATLAQVAVLAIFSTTLSATEFHVAPDGNDTNRGTRKAALRTIQRAADLAQPGDVITVQGGVYRERINPPRGGGVIRQKDRVSGRARGEGRAQRFGSNQRLGQTRPGHLEDNPRQFILWNFQSLPRPDSW